MMMMMMMTMMTNTFPYRRTKTHIWDKVLMGIWVHPINLINIVNIRMIITITMVIMITHPTATDSSESLVEGES